MSKRIEIGSEFLSMNRPQDKQWLRNIYWGFTNGTGSHGHLVASGSLIAGTWYLRDINDNEIIKNGSELTNNTSQLLSDCIPNILRGFQHPEQPLFWNVGSLDSSFSLQKKLPQQSL
jgi:hypothetical protein